MSYEGRGLGWWGWAGAVAAVAALTAGAGCASPNVYVRPTTAQIAAAEDAVKVAREKGADRDERAAPFLRVAEEQLASGRKRLDQGDNRGATWLLARAAADGQLSQVMVDKSRMEAEAATTESQLAQTRSEAARLPPPPAPDVPPQQ